MIDIDAPACNISAIDSSLNKYSESHIFRVMDISPATLFTTLGHDTRLRCLLLLLEFDELCVCELTHAIGATQPHISRHLGQLREAGLVVDRRTGLWIHYRIHPELPAWVLAVLEATSAGNGKRKLIASEAAALKVMPNRPAASLCA